MFLNNIAIIAVGMLVFQDTADTDIVREGKISVDIPTTGGDLSTNVLSYEHQIRGACGQMSIFFKSQQRQKSSARKVFSSVPTTLVVRRNNDVLLSDPRVLRPFDDSSIVGVRPTCDNDVLGLELILSNHDDEPQLVRRFVQFKDGEVSYFFQEPLDSMERVRWAVPR